MKGICGKLRDIDLTSARTGEIGISTPMAKKYLGGEKAWGQDSCLSCRCRIRTRFPRKIFYSF
jgi:hypothetical protein